MTDISKPAIIVVAFNRVNSLKRLLNSLVQAHYAGSVDLIISIDYSGNDDVKKYAESFVWRFGNKRIIAHSKRLGLKDHVLSCGDLVYEYNNIIILEDDLYVSPYFYDYAVRALEFYCDDNKVSGISLYLHSYNETARLPFHPIEDGNDVFFLQIASSWGQIISRKNWIEFRKWYDGKPALDKITDLPINVKNWPDHSWKKYFIAYLIFSKTYFVYPRISLTTNFSDAGGQNIKRGKELQQVPLLIGHRKEWKFCGLKDSISVYDSHCELSPALIRKLCTGFEGIEFEVDLYGTKETRNYKDRYMLTSKRTKRSIMSFGLNLKPIDLNIILKNDGLFFHLSDTKDISASLWNLIFNKITLFNYFYRETSGKMYIFLLLNNILSKFKQ